MADANPQESSSGPRLIFACSGCADVGEIADRAARKMTRDGAGRMFCLAGIGGRVEPIMNKTRAASELLAVDGCELDCVKNCLIKAGFTEFRHLRITDLGLPKGGSPATDENINGAARKASELLAKQ